MNDSRGYPAVILDRDGVINNYRPDYVKSWDEFQFMSGSLNALRMLALSPLRIVVVTNQSAVGRGLVSRQVVEDINRRMTEEIARAGGRVDQVFYCPHPPGDECDCRKPRPGLIFRASRELNLDLRHSYCVGDSIDDVSAAHAAGCTAILVLTGRGTKTAEELGHSPAERPVIVSDLRGAADWILPRLTQ